MGRFRIDLNRTEYDKLGIAETFTCEDIEGVRRVLSKRFHPDSLREPNEARMTEINNACDILEDPKDRREYDEALAEARSRARTTNPRAGEPAAGSQPRQAEPPRPPRDRPRPSPSQPSPPDSSINEVDVQEVRRNAWRGATIASVAVMGFVVLSAIAISTKVRQATGLGFALSLGLLGCLLVLYWSARVGLSDWKDAVAEERRRRSA